MSKSINIALLGCGTVGSGVISLIKKYQEARREPIINLKKIFVRDQNRAQNYSNKFNLAQEIFTWSLDDIISDDSIEIVVETIGGLKLSKEAALKAIKKNKHLVTANKDLLALEGETLFEVAKKHGVNILYEAAVAGGIPIISTLKQGLQANKIEKLYGIINGTTNYILDVMKKNSLDFGTALKQAQQLGFAEADPINDIAGHDAAYKTSILASIISNKRVDVKKIYREGIEKITSADIESATKRGFRIKLLGVIDNTGETLDARVHPMLVSINNPLASVSLENNAISITGDAVQELTLIGKGAGSLPTASSVFGDVLILASELAKGQKLNPQFICKHHNYAQMKNIDDVENSFYIRVVMLDKIGVLKDLGAITAKHKANVKFIDQYDVHDNEARADFIITPIKESTMKSMISDIEKLDSIKSVESVIRVLG